MRDSKTVSRSAFLWGIAIAIILGAITASVGWNNVLDKVQVANDEATLIAVNVAFARAACGGDSFKCN